MVVFKFSVHPITKETECTARGGHAAPRGPLAVARHEQHKESAWHHVRGWMRVGADDCAQSSHTTERGVTWFARMMRRIRVPVGRV